MSAHAPRTNAVSTPADLRALAAAAPTADGAGLRARDTDLLCADTIRMLAVDMVNAANSGHPGMPMGMADVAHVLWTRFLRYDPKDPAWRDRDRFVLSAGHGSALLYAMLHLSGYDLPMDEIRRFRQMGSRTPGHPEHGITAGVEVTTGPLGQGIANAVGMALAQKMTAARYGAAVASGRVFAIAGDGCLMEGMSAEAASLAGHWRLGNLKVCYDSNRISIDGSTDIAFSEDVAKRFEAHGWHVVACDGHDHAAVAAALGAAIAVTDRPSLVVCRTLIGKGSPNRQGSEKAHGAPLGPDETKLTKAAFGWPLDPAFLVPREVYERYAAREAELRAVRAEWDRAVAAWRASDAAAAAKWDAQFATGALSAADLLETLAKGGPFGSKATRQHSQAIQQKVAAEVPNLVGGSADLTHSNLTLIDGTKPVGLPMASPDFSGRNVHFGVREHAMGAIANGMAAHGAWVPYTATFLAFLDYMRTPVRLASLSHHGVVFVFSHDSIGLGEDGPTHQPVEHLWTARMIPGMTLHRPADGLETAAAWADAATRRDGPTVIVTSRQKLPELPRPAGFRTSDLLRGGAVVVDGRDAAGAGPDVVLIATGSEVGVALDAAKRLGEKGTRCRVVSMPSVELFDRQDAAWKASVIPPGSKRVAIEAGRPDGWWRFVGECGLVLGIETFGMSAPAEQIFDHFGLTGPKAAERIAKHFGFAL